MGPHCRPTISRVAIDGGKAATAKFGDSDARRSAQEVVTRLPTCCAISVHTSSLGVSIDTTSA